MQVAVYAFEHHLKASRTELMDVIDECLIEALSYPSDRRYYRFMPLEQWQFVFPVDRSEKYTIVQMLLFAGRPDGTIRRLIHLLYDRLPPKLDVRPLDLEFIVQEVPRCHWGLRGAVADEYDLGYSITV